MSKHDRPKISKSKRQQARERRQVDRQRRRWLTAAAGLAAMVLVGAVVLWPRPKAEPVSAARLTDDPSLGLPKAMVTIVEYGDFGCTTCRAWHKAGVLQQIRAQYGDKVRFVWRDFPIITAESPKAAEAGQYAYDQNEFWEYHDMLYDRAPTLSVSDLKAYAAGLRLDTARFNQCLDSGQYQAKVEHELQDAFARGFQGTPSSLVNDQTLAGPLSFEYLQSLVDLILTSGK